MAAPRAGARGWMLPLALLLIAVQLVGGDEQPATALSGSAQELVAPAAGNSSALAPPTAGQQRRCVRKAGSKSKHVACFSGGGDGAPAAAGAVGSMNAPLLFLSGAAAAVILLVCVRLWYTHRRHSGPTYARVSTQEDDWTGSMGMEQWDEAGQAFSEQLRTEPRWRRIVSRCRDLCAGRLTVSPNAKVLIVAIVAFGLITVAQTFAALFANSLALLGDCASMAVDTLTYCGNLYAEVVPQGSPRETKKAQLIASAASLLVLTSVTVAVVVDAMERMQTEAAALEAAATAAAAAAAATEGTAAVAGTASSSVEGVEEVNPFIVLTFAILGLVLDCATFAAFHVWGGAADAAAEDAQQQQPPETPLQKQRAGAAAAVPAKKNTPAQPVNDDDDDGGADAAGETAPAPAPAPAPSAALSAAGAGSQLNMCSAFLHVLADCMRSTTTLTEAVLIGWYGFDSERTDAIASLIVSGTILLGCAAAAVVWVRSAWRFRVDDAKSSRGTCRAGEAAGGGGGRDFGFVGHSRGRGFSSAGTAADGTPGGSLSLPKKVVGVKVGMPALPLDDFQTVTLEAHQPQAFDTPGGGGGGGGGGGSSVRRSPTIASQMSLDSYS